MIDDVQLRRDLRRMMKTDPLPIEQVPDILLLTPMQLYEVDRLASQGLSLETIRSALRLPHNVWNTMVDNSPQIRDAWEQGRTRLADCMTLTIVRAGKAGDVTAAKYMLDRIVPEFKPRPASATVVVNNGPVFTADRAELQGRFERQSRLLDGTIELDEGAVVETTNGPAE